MKGKETFCLFRADCVVLLLQHSVITAPCVPAAAHLELVSSTLALVAFGFYETRFSLFIEMHYFVIFHKLCQSDIMFFVNARVHPELRECTGLSAKQLITGHCLSTNQLMLL